MSVATSSSDIKGTRREFIPLRVSFVETSATAGQLEIFDFESARRERDLLEESIERLKEIFYITKSSNLTNFF